VRERPVKKGTRAARVKVWHIYKQLTHWGVCLRCILQQPSAGPQINYSVTAADAAAEKEFMFILVLLKQMNDSFLTRAARFGRYIPYTCIFANKEMYKLQIKQR
jgi:hypothetical protein